MHLVLCERSFSLQQHPGLKSRCRLSCCRAKELDTIPKQLRQRVAVACPFGSPRLTTALWIVRDLTRPIPFQQVRRQCTAHEDIYVRFSRSVHLTTLATSRHFVPFWLWTVRWIGTRGALVSTSFNVGADTDWEIHMIPGQLSCSHASPWYRNRLQQDNKVEHL